MRTSPAAPRGEPVDVVLACRGEDAVSADARVEIDGRPLQLACDDAHRVAGGDLLVPPDGPGHWAAAPVVAGLDGSRSCMASGRRAVQDLRVNVDCEAANGAAHLRIGGVVAGGD